MPYKTTSKTQFRKNIKKSIVVGLVMLFFDFIAHSTIGNPETIGYFIAKPIIAGYVVYIYYNRKWKRYIITSNIFALIHGLYYRIIELIYSKPLFSRVGDVHIGTITFKANIIWQGIFAWWIIHGGAFLLGIYIANFLEKKK